MEAEVLEAMDAAWAKARAAMVRAVESAPDGRVISGSEWEVKGAGQELVRECYQTLVQARLEQRDRATGAAFSPGGHRGE